MDLKIFTDLIEEGAKNQVYEMAKLYDKEVIRIMPDVHKGIGSVIGFTCQIDEESKIVPNIVGVDIGCGVHAFNLGTDDINLEELDNFIRENIPHGFNVNHEVQKDFDLTKLRCYNKLTKIPRLHQSLGSLGGGNHFIEIDIALNGDKWLVIHSGSRNLGHQIATYYQQLAYDKMVLQRRKEIDEIIQTIPPLEREVEIKRLPKIKIDKQTAWLVDKKDKDDYLNDMLIATQFAVHNRIVMANNIKEFLGFFDHWHKEDILSVHNYISPDGFIRKGAILANKNEKCIIPINMRDGVIIAVGKSNKDWNYSAPHGAGRLMGRRKAKETLNMEDFKDSMKDIYTTSVNENTLDEAPMVYKPIESILDYIKDTVEVVEILKPIYNFKAN